MSNVKRRPVLDLSGLQGRRPAPRSPVKAVSRGKSGHVRGRMNGLERAYAELLDIELAERRILKWRFEEVSFVLSRPPAGGKAVTWTPDFWVQRPMARSSWSIRRGLSARPSEPRSRSRPSGGKSSMWLWCGRANKVGPVR